MLEVEMAIRVGLCCTFLEQPIRFRTATARYVLSLKPKERATYLDQIAFDNALALKEALTWCGMHGVGAFRINSQFLPLYTHPAAGYSFDDLTRASEIKILYEDARKLAQRYKVRLSFHPDQFVVPGSNNPEVVKASLLELNYQARVAAMIGAEQLTLHGGGAYGDKTSALKRLVEGLDQLPEATRALIALENDDRIYTVKDLLPVSENAGIPLIYDVHHHRCLPDGLSVEEATDLCGATWKNREPWLHISSPLEGWRSKDPRIHADYINPRDFPKCWLGRSITVDVEAKAKELAVLKLLQWLKTK
jgi:UV DNA damage endonuclease